MISRRTCLTAIALLTAACSGSEKPQEDQAAAQKNAVEDFHFISGTFNTAIGPDGNTEIYKAPDGLIVIDTGRHPAHAQAILDYAKAQGAPIAAIINTHWHLDHTTGNLDIKAVYPDVKVYATHAIDGALKGFLAENIASVEEKLNDPSMTDDHRARIERFLKAIRSGALLPTAPIEKTMRLAADGRDLELNVTHRAVTESDIWLWDPATKTVIAGDIVTLPAPLFDTACADGWSAAFDDIEKKPISRVVPGHGYIMTADEFRLYHKAFNNMVACAADKTGAECAKGWLADAGPLLDKAAGEDFADKAYAKEAVEYYVDEIIKSPEMRREYCGSD